MRSKIPADEEEAIGDEVIAIAERIRKKYNLTPFDAKLEVLRVARDVSL